MSLRFQESFSPVQLQFAGVFIKRCEAALAVLLVKSRPARLHCEDDGGTKDFAVNLHFSVSGCQEQLYLFHYLLVKNKKHSVSSIRDPICHVQWRVECD